MAKKNKEKKRHASDAKIEGKNVKKPLDCISSRLVSFLLYLYFIEKEGMTDKD